MALYPEGDKLDKYPSRYVLTNLAARRAKQIKDGDSPLVATESTHPLTIALEEIADGAIQAIFREGEIEAIPADNLQSIDLLAQEAGTLDAGFADIGAVFGEDEAISLDDLMRQENALEGDVEEENEGPNALETIASLADFEDDDDADDED